MTFIDLFQILMGHAGNADWTVISHSVEWRTIGFTSKCRKQAPHTNDRKDRQKTTHDAKPCGFDEGTRPLETP
jgi:hypothetical protein